MTTTRRSRPPITMVDGEGVAAVVGAGIVSLRRRENSARDDEDYKTIVLTAPRNDTVHSCCVTRTRGELYRK